MKRTLALIMMVVGLALSMVGGVAAADSNSTILSPEPGEMVYSGTLELRASTSLDSSEEVAWAVRSAVDNPECGLNQADLAGWRSGNDITWEDGQFQADIDVTGWAAGLYCFAFNPKVGGDFNVQRAYVEFYIVDGAIVADASIDEALHEYLPDTAKPDYSVSGTIGLLGGGELMGTLELRYHADKITCMVDVSTGVWRDGDTGFVLDGDSIDDFAGVDDADYTCSDGASGTFDDIFFLDPAATGVPGWPGGAVVVDEDGDRTTSGPYDLIGELASSYYWVPLDRGDVTFYNIW